MSVLPLRTRAIVQANDALGSQRRLTIRVPGWSSFEPGQFAMLSAGSVGSAPRTDPLLSRPMAIHRVTPAADGAGDVELIFKVVGRGTALLAEALPGAALSWVGPLGRGFSLPAPGQHALLVGGGTGIASLHELAARASVRSRVELFLGGRTSDDLRASSDFLALPARVALATEDGSAGWQGRVTGLLERRLRESRPALVYACGPTPMMRESARLSKTVGVPCLVSLENPMACGFGVCLGCAVPLAGGANALVCRDGPVFDADRVDWERLP